MGRYRKKSITSQNHEEFWFLWALKPAVKMQKMKPSKVRTHNFDASFLKTSNTEDGAKQFWGDMMHKTKRYINEHVS